VHAQYALTEIADDCRHSTMFARMASSIGCPAYGPVPWLRKLAKLLPTISYSPARYGAILVAEEVLDRLQREQQGPGVYCLVLSFQVSQHGPAGSGSRGCRWLVSWVVPRWMVDAIGGTVPHAGRSRPSCPV
jgi:hypothetical protein